MDYSRLSRESLIHEIKQLNLENERIRLKSIGTQFGIQDCLNNIQSPSFIINPEYNVVWANKFCSDTYFEILEKKCYQVFHGFDDVCPGCLMQWCIRTRKQNEMIVQKTLEGTVVNTSVHFIPLIHEGNLQGILEIEYPIEDGNRNEISASENLSALKKDVLELNQKYQRTVELMHNYSMAMRVPIRSFIGYFQVFSMSSNDTLKTEYLEILKLNSESLYATLNKVLMFSKSDFGEIFGKRELFSLKRLIEETLLQVILPNENDSKARYNLNYTDTLPNVLFGDAFSLKLLLSYLVEFTQTISNRGFIEIELSDITQTHSNIVLKLSIQTTRDIESKSKALDYYDLFTNTKFESIEEYSLGLGLYLARKIVDLQKGTMEMTTGLDDKFYIDVTLNYDKVIPRFEEERKEPSHQKKKMLIADFEKPMLSLELLKNYEVYFTHSGEDTINQYFKIDPDLTIINVLIEDCDGFKVFDEIERRRKHITPIVAISYQLVDNEREFLRDYGFDEYYPKPLSDEKLKNIIENYF